MLEIFLLVWAGKKLARMAGEKGRSGGWAGLGVGLWIGGELLGGLIGGFLELDLGAYLVALVLAAVGLGIAFAVVGSLEPIGVVGASHQILEGTHDLSGASDPDNPYSPPRRM
jgi:hypothetical protein